MPRKSKITAVPIEPTEATEPTEIPPREGLDVARHALDENTYAEVTDFIKGLGKGETPSASGTSGTSGTLGATDETPEAPSEPVVLKAKAKRASRAKPKEELKEEPEVEVTSSALDEVQVEVTIPLQEEAKTDAKVDAKVACPDCGKQMSAKTLKYSHIPNCSAKKQADGAISQTAPLASSGIEEVIEDEVQKRLYNKRSERAARREEMVSKLMQNAF